MKAFRRNKPIIDDKLAILHWFIGTFFVFFQFTIQSSASVLSRVWMNDFHLDQLGLSYLSAAFYYTFLLSQIPVGMLYDRYSAKWVMAVAAFLLGLGCMMFAMTQNFYLAMLARMLMGFGASFGFIGLLHICSRWFEPRRFTFALGSSESVSMFVVMLGMVGISWLLASFGWRHIMFGMSAIAWLLAIFVISTVQDGPSDDEEAGNVLALRQILKQVPQLLRSKQVLLCGFYGFCTFSIVSAFTSLWGISFLNHADGMDRHTATVITSMVFVGLAVGCPLNGVLTNYFSFTKIMRAGALGALLTMGLAIMVPGLPHWSLFVLFLLTGFFCSTYVQTYSVVKAVVSRQVRVTAMAVVNMTIMLSAPVLQIIIGALLTHHIFGLVTDVAWIYRIALAVLPLGMLVAYLMMPLINEP